MSSAIYYASDGYQVEKNKIMGRQVAGNSFLKAYFKYINTNEFWVYAKTQLEADEFARFSRSEGRNEKVKFIDFQNTQALSQPGVLFYPGPDVSSQSKNRSFFKDNSWSICGITHTTSSAKAMESIQSIVTSPLHPWDAVICTSEAVKSNVLNIIEIEEENLRSKLKAVNFVRPRLPIIPLGVNSEEFKFNKEEKSLAREEFHILNNEIVVLYVGRLSFHAKANPFSMYKALENVANKTDKNIVLIECGWHSNKAIEDSFSQASKYLCPNIKIIRVDGRRSDLRLKSFAASDIFCSLSDNIQETFGITPIEAMASGLPVVVTDWNGYKDTVRDGIDGFRIPTVMPAEDQGNDLAFRYALNIDNYDMYIGNISNFISVNISALSSALSKLIENEKLRTDMGNNGISRVAANFDWSVIIPRYNLLWLDLEDCRKSSTYKSYKWSARLDPFFSFSSYSTNAITKDARIYLVDNNIDLSLKRLKEIRGLSIVNYSQYTAPDLKVAVKLLNRIDKNMITINQLKDDFPEINYTYLARSILWLSKFDIINIDLDYK